MISANQIFRNIRVQDCIVPRCKALLSDCYEPGGQWYGSTFKVYHTLLKTAILPHTEGLGKTGVPFTVNRNLDSNKEQVDKTLHRRGPLHVSGLLQFFSSCSA